MQADTPAGLAIDHVVIGVPDLDAAVRALGDRFGLAAVEGGRHPGWGTANKLVPLGLTYLELVGVVDPAEAAGSAFGRWVTSMAANGSSAGWAVRTADLDGAASRLGLDVVQGSRRRTTGSWLRWRLAGVAAAAADPELPFFIQWDAGTPLPGRTPVEHPAGQVRLESLHVEGDQRRLNDWLGPHGLPLVVAPGTRGVTGVRIASSTGGTLLVEPRTLR